MTYRGLLRGLRHFNATCHVMSSVSSAYISDANTTLWQHICKDHNDENKCTYKRKLFSYVNTT